MGVISKKKKFLAVILTGVILILCFIFNISESVSAETATGMKVTYKGAVSSMGSKCGKFTIKGRDAFCAEHPKATPASGTKITSTKLIDSSTMRKALYYGYGGPESKVNKNNSGWVYTSIALSRANGKGGGTASSKKFYNKLKNYPTPPNSFKVYYCKTSGGKQALCYWTYEPEGKLCVKKSSADPTVAEVDGYLLSGAIYGVYTDMACTQSNMTAKLTTEESGISNKVTLDTGTYYVKEITAPEGFLINDTVYTVNITDQCDTILPVEDYPESEPEWVMIKKVNAESGESVFVSDGELSGAEFTVKYYQGTDWTDNPADSGAQAKAEWIFRTNEKGYVVFGNEECFVSGDELYYNKRNVPTLPIGTITIQETKAPVGYNINEEVFVVKIPKDDNEPGVSLSQIPTTEVKEWPIRGDLEIIKTDSNTGKALQGVSFDVIDVSDNKIAATLVTNENGYATTVSEDNTKSGLFYGTYIVREREAPIGYVPMEDMEIKISKDKERVLLELENKPAQIRTTATFKENGEKKIIPAKTVTIVDEVRYENLIPGTTYKLVGILMDTSSGRPLLVDDKEITSEVEFTAETASGTQNMEFVLDAIELSGKSVTVFEELYLEGSKIAEHADITDTEQTVGFIENNYIVDTADHMQNRFFPVIMLCLISFVGALASAKIRRTQIRKQ